MKRTLILSAILLTAAMAVKADRTTRARLKVATPTTIVNQTGAVNDTVVPSAGMVVVSGFEKPLRSYKESVFVTNHSRRRLIGVSLQLSYLDADGRLLHRAVKKFDVDIPAGETRQITFPSWDRQQSFYYVLSSKPRTADGTPFSVEISTVAAVFPLYSSAEEQM